MVKVSVIIPVYNVEKYVGECLESVMNQTLREIEIICVNDHSADASWEIVNEMAARDERVKLFENQENRGQSFTRNRGLSAARGRYIYMLDADDSIQHTALWELYERCEAENLEVISFGASLLFEEGAFAEKFHGYRKGFRCKYERMMTGRELFIVWQENQDWTCSSPRFFYKRRFLEENAICFMEGIVHEDEAFAFEVLMKAERVRCIENPYFNRRFRANSTMTAKKSARNIEGYLLTLWRVLQLWHMQPGDQCFERAVRRYVWQIYQDIVKIYMEIEESLLGAPFCSGYEPVNILFSLIQELNVGKQALGILQGKETYQKLCTLESVYIYGAGDYARRIITFLDRMEIVIKGLLVEDKKKNPRAVCGIKVYELPEVSAYGETVILGISNKFREEVSVLLTKEGFENILEIKF